MILGSGMLFALAFVCLLHPVLAGSGDLGTAVSIALMGILIYGADVLISAMAVLDAVPVHLHGRAAGFVNGIGSIGQTLSPFLVTIFVLHWGWTSSSIFLSSSRWLRDAFAPSAPISKPISP